MGHVLGRKPAVPVWAGPRELGCWART